jgi:GDPmannose 4,6-dehydratase
MTKQALITGVTGQDGYYLSEHLRSQGYTVFGQTRNPRNASLDLRTLAVNLVSFDLTSSIAWKAVFDEYAIDEVYHLAGVSFVPTSWSSPSETITANVQITAQILEAMRSASNAPRLFYACSSEVFGQADSPSQNEQTPLRPINPYGVTKAASLGLIDCYRRRYGLFATAGILYNHESPRRDPTFVTRKISTGVAAIAQGRQPDLVLGHLGVHRDWGYARDYVDCMHRILQADTPEDFVIGSGRLTTLEKLVEIAFNRVGLNWRNHVVIDPRFSRPNEQRTLVADCTKASELLGWNAVTTIEELMSVMVDFDLSETLQNRIAA